MKIRHAGLEDLDQICEMERECFPPAEAAGRDTLLLRLKTFPETFWVAEEEGGKLVGMINGMASGEQELTDRMYEGTELFCRDGAWLMLFGVDTRPGFEGRGIASAVMERVIADSKKQGRRGIVLLCKERLIPFYQRFGYGEEGLSQSSHGGERWYQMRLVLEA